MEEQKKSKGAAQHSKVQAGHISTQFKENAQGDS
jgi:hypothetical protein